MLRIRDNEMNELVKVLGKFFTRDFLYIIGGASIVTSILYTRDICINTLDEEPIEIKIFVIGVCYVLGYITQDGLSFLTPSIVTTSQVEEPCKFMKRAYKRFTKDKWEQIPRIDYVKTRIELEKKYPQRDALKELDRTISLKQVGTTMGSCWLVSAFIIIVNGIFSKTLQVIELGAIIIALAIILLIIGRLKGMQQYQILHRLNSADTRNKSKSDKNDRNS